MDLDELTALPEDMQKSLLEPSSDINITEERLEEAGFEQEEDEIYSNGEVYLLYNLEEQEIVGYDQFGSSTGLKDGLNYSKNKTFESL